MGYSFMRNSKIIHHPGIIVEMMEDYYSHCSGVDFYDIKVEHGRYFIGKDYYLYRDLMDKDLADQHQKLYTPIYRQTCYDYPKS